MDQLEQRVGEFFANAKKNKPEWRDEQMTAIKKVSCRLYVAKDLRVETCSRLDT